MTTIAEQAKSNLDSITEITKDDLSLTGYKARGDRDLIVLTVLERIKNTPGIDKEKYMAAVLEAAKTSVTENQAALQKLKELREAGASTEEIKAHFDANPKLVEARAHLVLGAGLTRANPDSDDAKLFSGFLEGEDKEGSTHALIEIVSSNVNATLEELHNASVTATSASIEKIKLYLEQIKKAKEEAQNNNDAQGAGSDVDVEADQAVLIAALGVELDESGKIIKVVDPSKASKIFGGDVNVGDAITEMWTVPEKYAGSASMQHYKGDTNGYYKILNDTKGLQELGFVLKIGSGERRVFGTPGDLSSVVGSKTNSGANTNVQSPLSELALMVKSDTEGLGINGNVATLLQRKNLLTQFHNLCVPRPTTVLEGVIAFEKELQNSSSPVDPATEQRRQRQLNLLDQYKKLYQGAATNPFGLQS